MGYFHVRYDSIVVYYDRRGFIRLATGHTEYEFNINQLEYRNYLSLEGSFYISHNVLPSSLNRGKSTKIRRSDILSFNVFYFIRKKYRKHLKFKQRLFASDIEKRIRLELLRAYDLDRDFRVQRHHRNENQDLKTIAQLSTSLTFE